MIAGQLSLMTDDRCSIFRYGGEEFAILFDDCEIDDILRLVNNCRDGLAGKSLVDIQTGRSIGQVTFSAGIARCLTSDSKKTLVGKADTALYDAKSAGRNRVHFYSNNS